MIVRETIRNNCVRIYSDAGKMIIRDTDKREFSSAIQKADSNVTYTEAE